MAFLIIHTNDGDFAVPIHKGTRLGNTGECDIIFAFDAPEFCIEALEKPDGVVFKHISGKFDSMPAIGKQLKLSFEEEVDINGVVICADSGPKELTPEVLFEKGKRQLFRFWNWKYRTATLIGAGLLLLLIILMNALYDPRDAYISDAAKYVVQRDYIGARIILLNGIDVLGGDDKRLYAALKRVMYFERLEQWLVQYPKFKRTHSPDSLRHAIDFYESVLDTIKAPQEEKSKMALRKVQWRKTAKAYTDTLKSVLNEFEKLSTVLDLLAEGKKDSALAMLDTLEMSELLDSILIDKYREVVEEQVSGGKKKSSKSYYSRRVRIQNIYPGNIRVETGEPIQFTANIFNPAGLKVRFRWSGSGHLSPIPGSSKCSFVSNIPGRFNVCAEVFAPEPSDIKCTKVRVVAGEGKKVKPSRKKPKIPKEKYDRAIKLYNEARGLSDGLGVDDIPKAMQILKEVMYIYPDSSSALFNRANSLYDKISG